MSTENDLAAAAAAAVAEKCCASCGVAEIDNIILKPCPHCDLVEYCSAMNVSRNIYRIMKQSVKKGLPNCMTKFCSSSLRATISMTARFVVCPCRPRSMANQRGYKKHVVENLSVLDAHILMI